MQRKAKRPDERRHQQPSRTSHSGKSRRKRARVSLAAPSIDRLFVSRTRKDFEWVLAHPRGAQAVLKGFGRRLQWMGQRLNRIKQRQKRIRQALERIERDAA